MALSKGWPLTDRVGGASFLPYTSAGVMGSDDDDDDDPLLKAKGETPSFLSFFYCKRVSCAEVVKITMQHCSDKTSIHTYFIHG